MPQGNDSLFDKWCKENCIHTCKTTAAATKESGPRFYMTYKNQLKMDERLKCKTQNNAAGRKQAVNSSTLVLATFFGICLPAQEQQKQE